MRKEQYETSVMGIEPSWNNVEKMTDSEISDRFGKAVNWYNYFCSSDEYREYVLEYCKKNCNKETYNQIKSMDKNNSLFRSLGAACRVMNLGGKIPPKDMNFFQVHYSNLLKQSELVVVKEEEKVVVSANILAERIGNKIANTISDLEVKIDEFITTSDYKSFLKSFNIEAWIINNKLKSYECIAIRDYYQRSMKEKQDALEGNDPQLTEAYSYLGKVKLRKFVDLLTHIVEVTGQYGLQKRERKPRKKKKKSAEQLIKKLKYQKDDTDTGLTSVDPRDIIGASKLVVYNTKYSKVCIYESESLDGLSVKGTTLLNVNKGVCKTVRKPKDFFRSLGGVRSIANHYDSLKTKESEASPRLGENTIIVKAFK